ncbi:protein of unknown function (plasmid) [Cardinium endosymbiont cEper1 of Encarsia pergandiella]|nr:protein of unknown function [Cardinium endosymbiont cEper1 of Encarsia pergandiella]
MNKLFWFSCIYGKNYLIKSNKIYDFSVKISVKYCIKVVVNKYITHVKITCFRGITYNVCIIYITCIIFYILWPFD